MEDVITINVSGLKFQTRKSTLNRFPTTLLGSSDREKHYNSSTKEYFFDRHRESFETILYFYQSDGLLCLPATLNADIFMEEVRFFRIGDHILEKLSPDVSNTKQIVLPDHPIQKKVWQVCLMFIYYEIKIFYNSRITHYSKILITLQRLDFHPREDFHGCMLI